ncbi:MAG: FHA domain-containing protein [Nitrospirae bacterium]|nr:MAG: FHA domain-containing protein [Nitrospirota bacterium]
MTKEIFPEGEAVFRHKPHSAELFTITVDEIDKAGESFIGIIRVDEPDAAYFLFFLRGDAYAAGYITNGKPMPLSIKDFVQHMSVVTDKRTLSLSKIDPVLLKGMLVFLQREPSLKATTDMINLENILSHIKAENAPAFVVLKKNSMYNFFYFHSGEPKMAHFADASWMQAETGPQREEIPLLEQVLLYAYPPDKTPVEVMVYRDIKTSEASDTSEIKQFLISDSLLADRKKIIEQAPVETPAPKEEKAVRLRIEVTEGPQKGSKFNVPLPCTIGRRDADLRIRDMTVSKRHASLEASGKNIIFKDLDSTNGSMVNGKQVKETELSNGDIIQIGDTTLKIQFVTN